MWLQRTPEEFAAALRKDYFFQFGLGLFFGGISGLLGAYGYNRWIGALTRPSPEIGTVVGSVLIFGLLFGILFALFQGGEKTWICTSCENTKKKYGSINCSCGGKYQDIRKVKWVEDKIKEEQDKQQP